MLKNLKIPIFFLSFVNNGLLISQEKSFKKTNSFLFCNYNIISSLLDRFGLAIKHGKTEVFYFFRSQEDFNPPLLDLLFIKGPILTLKTTW